MQNIGWRREEKCSMVGKMTKNKKPRHCWVCSNKGQKKLADIYIYVRTLQKQSEIFKEAGIGRYEWVCMKHYQFALQELADYFTKCAEQSSYWNLLDLK
jgi:hypothetical protein